MYLFYWFFTIQASYYSTFLYMLYKIFNCISENYHLLHHLYLYTIAILTICIIFIILSLFYYRFMLEGFVIVLIFCIVCVAFFILSFFIVILYLFFNSSKQVKLCNNQKSRVISNHKLKLIYSIPYLNNANILWL